MSTALDDLLQEEWAKISCICGEAACGGLLGFGTTHQQ
jgi:hypothetical protein